MILYVLRTYPNEHKWKADGEINGVFTDIDELVEILQGNKDELGLNSRLTDSEIEEMAYNDFWRLNSELTLAGIECFRANVF